MPREVTLHRSAGWIAEAAAGLLAAGVLRADDWNGDLIESLHLGLVRWAHEVLGDEHGEGFQRLDLALIYTDDVENIDFSADDWIESRLQRRPTAGTTVGAFAFCVERGWDVVVGGTVLALEKARRGLGYQILGLLDHALWRTVRGLTLSWAFDEVVGWNEDLAPEDKDPDYLTEERFLDSVPLAAVQAGWDPADLKRLRGARRVVSGPLREVVDAAIALAELLTLVQPANTEDDFGVLDMSSDQRQVLPVAIRWSEEDEIPRIWDDFHEMIAQCGGECRYVWTRAFHVGEPRTLTDAVADLQCMLQLAARIDRLLYLMDGAGRGKALVDIFREKERVRV